MEKLKMHSPDFVDENIAKLAELFPNCVTESRDNKGNLKKSIDLDLFRQELSGNIVEGPQERYHLDWPGKKEALLTANAPIAKTLRPCREESVDFETTQNLFIEGDNLDALKLLQETYLGKVKKRMGKGFSKRSLEHYRKFYLTYKEIAQAVPAKSSEQYLPLISQPDNLKAVIDKLNSRFVLGWTHYVTLLTVKNSDERSFYEIEAAENDWGYRELERQINSGLYERLALSRDKAEVKRLSTQGQVVEKPSDVIKNPYILEFTGLEERKSYSEHELEIALIDKIEQFLLELGKGFLFESRQKRFSFDNRHFYVDLVFYNRLLCCYVIIDLKVGDLKHQDLGQIQMYVNYFDRFVKLVEEKPTVGILLCLSKSDEMVQLTLPEDSNIYASEYQLYLPSKEELKKQLEEVQKDWEMYHEK